MNASQLFVTEKQVRTLLDQNPERPVRSESLKRINLQQ